MSVELIKWIEKCSGEDQEGELMDWLKDGRVLCALANGLSEKEVIKVRSKKQHTMFHALESVSAFLRWCIGTAGIQKYSCFTAPDLLENQNEKRVLTTLLELRGIFDKTQSPRTIDDMPDDTSSNRPAKLDKSLFSAFTPKEEDSSAKSKLTRESSGAISEKLQNYVKRASTNDVGEQIATSPGSPSKLSAFLSKSPKDLSPKFAVPKHVELLKENRDSKSKLSAFLSVVPSPNGSPYNLELEVDEASEAPPTEEEVHESPRTSKLQEFLTSPRAAKASEPSQKEYETASSTMSFKSDSGPPSPKATVTISSPSKLHEFLSSPRATDVSNVVVSPTNAGSLMMETPRDSSERKSKLSDFLKRVPSSDSYSIEEDVTAVAPLHPGLDAREESMESTPEIVLTPSPRTLAQRKMEYSEEEEAASDAMGRTSITVTELPERPSMIELPSSPRNAQISAMDVESEIKELKVAATEHDSRIDSHVNEINRQLATITAEKQELQQQSVAIQQQIDSGEEDLLHKLEEEKKQRDILQQELDATTKLLEESLADAEKQKREEAEFVSKRLDELETAFRLREEADVKAQAELAQERSRVVELEKEAEESLIRKKKELVALQEQIDALQSKFLHAERAAAQADQILAEKETQIQLAKDREDAARYSAQQAFAARELAVEQAERQDYLIEKLSDENVTSEEKLAAMVDARVTQLRIQMEREFAEREAQLRMEFQQ